MINISDNISNEFSSNLTTNLSLVSGSLMENSSNSSEVFSFSSFKSEFVYELVNSYSLTETILYFILTLLISFFIFKIFKESKFINNFINLENLDFFSKSFFNYFIVAMCSVYFFALILLNNFYVLSENFIFYSAIVSVFSFFLFSWIARSYLLASILYRYFNGENSTFSKIGFLVINFILIATDFIISIVFMFISYYLFVGYNVLILCGFLYGLNKKVSFKNIGKHVTYFAIILLLLLRVTSSITFLFDDIVDSFYLEFTLDLFSLVIYILIFYRLLVWRKKFEK